MNDEKPLHFDVRFTPEFKRNLRQLATKYRRIKADVQPLIDTLQQGQTPGDQIPGVQYEVFKFSLNPNIHCSNGYVTSCACHRS